MTFFRVGVDSAPVNPSAWAVRDLFMAHLAVSDPDGDRYRFDEKLTRGGPGIVGRGDRSLRVWNEEWTRRAGRRRAATRFREEPAGRRRAAAGRRQAVRSSTASNGISQKGAQAGNASHYYSLTRMPTRGAITVDGERFEVTGESWMDHEFGTSFLEREQQGWDWLSFSSADGRELMLYQLRRGDGTRDPRSSGTLVDRAGPRRPTSRGRRSRWRRRAARSRRPRAPPIPSNGRSPCRRRARARRLHAAHEPGAGHPGRRHRLLGRPGGRHRHVARRRDRGQADTSR